MKTICPGGGTDLFTGSCILRSRHGDLRVGIGTVLDVVDVDGHRHALTRARTVIGRGSDADITIADAGSSRKHVEILWDGERAMMRDLGSTSGTKGNGEKVREARLPTDSTITIGRTDLVFRVVPIAAPSIPTSHSDHRSATPGASGTRGPGSGSETA